MILCENLVKIYKQTGIDVLALQGLDLTVQAGEMIGIVGESGSGKSTLMNILGGLDTPSAGKVIVNETDLLKLGELQRDSYRRRQVGFLWQQTARNLIPWLTALENVMLPMLPDTNKTEKALELLEMVGLKERAEHLPRELSGGEQQRASIALTLANHPSLLLADEPTGELDTVNSRMIYGLLQKVNREFGTTIIIVSHDPEIARYVGRVVAIRDGKTSTETVSTQTSEKENSLDELLMLDSAGRLQLPSQVLETLSIGTRVRLGISEDKVILEPVDGYRREVREHEQNDFGFLISGLEASENEAGNAKKTNFFSRLFGRKTGD